jgi:malonyl-CoA O-methyltransferase
VTRAVPGPLPAREAYALWAAAYDVENPVTRLDRQAVSELTPPVAHRRLLDAGCGTGRRLAALSPGEPALAVGLDLARDMLLAGLAGTPLFARHVQGDVRYLPLADATMDVIWCRLVLGHTSDLRGAYSEFRRVAASGARLIVTDFHPDALRAGHRRTFRDPRGALREIETHPHTPDAHAAAAQAAGFSSADVREYRVGPLVKTLYEAAGRRAHYDQDVGLPLVFGLGCLAY